MAAAGLRAGCAPSGSAFTPTRFTSAIPRTA
jgi:hypothetical protein